MLLLALLAWGFGSASRAPAAPAGAAPPGSAPPAGRAPPLASTAPPPAAARPGSGSAFESAASCSTELAAGRRLPRPAGVARFASWNLHWFPDGQPGRSTSGADLAWLACVLWWLDADVVAVQEVKQKPHADQALQQLLSELNRISGARFRAKLDDCGSRVPQHVGLLWNEARATPSELVTVAALNPSGEPCSQQWRPGFGARLRFTGGLDLLAISGHFKSMSDERSLELRKTSFGAVAGVLKDSEHSSRDADFLLLGDLNTMGCEACSPPVSAQQELGAAARVLASGDLRLVPADAPGSHFHEGRATLLDHAVASRRMRELDPAARSHVAGACDASSPKPSSRIAKKTQKHLSDHCPIVLDLADRDLD